jgi:hypothetical protein
MGYDAPKARPESAAADAPAPRELAREPRRRREPESTSVLNQSLEERASSGLNYTYGSDSEIRQRRRRGIRTGGF